MMWERMPRVNPFPIVLKMVLPSHSAIIEKIR
jgi:hypothetical protein